MPHSGFKPCILPCVVICFASHVNAYKDNVHLPITVLLAEVAGLRPDRAFEISKWTLSADYDPLTNPLNRFNPDLWNVLGSFHFAKPLDLERRHKEALQCEVQIVGRFLHALEDSHGSHAAWLDQRWHDPWADNPWRDSPAFAQAFRDAFRALVELRQACNLGGAEDQATFATIDGYVQSWATIESRSGPVHFGAEARWAELERQLYTKRWGPTYPTRLQQIRRDFDQWRQIFWQ